MREVLGGLGVGAVGKVLPCQHSEVMGNFEAHPAHAGQGQGTKCLFGGLWNGSSMWAGTLSLVCFPHLGPPGETSTRRWSGPCLAHPRGLPIGISHAVPSGICFLREHK